MLRKNNVSRRKNETLIRRDNPATAPPKGCRLVTPLEGFQIEDGEVKQQTHSNGHLENLLSPFRKIYTRFSHTSGHCHYLGTYLWGFSGWVPEQRKLGQRILQRMNL